MSAAEEAPADEEPAVAGALEVVLVPVFVEPVLGEVEELQAAAAASTRAAGAMTKTARVRVTGCIVCSVPRVAGAGREDTVSFRYLGTDPSHERFIRPGGAPDGPALTW
jgi:hypothetical protein